MTLILNSLSNGAVLLFVVTTMLAIGLSLTVSQIFAPLRQWKLTVRVLLANFVLVPALAFALTLLIPLSDPLKIGLLLLGAAAGAPFLPKLAQFAHSQVALSVVLMVLLMVVTIFYLPIVLPLLLPGVKGHPFSIAVSLVLTMLVPLGLALFVRMRYPEPAGQLQRMMGQASNIALLLKGSENSYRPWRKSSVLTQAPQPARNGHDPTDWSHTGSLMINVHDKR